MSVGHPWKDLEPQLQKIRELSIQSEERRSREVSDAINSINHFIVRDAARILHSPKLRRFQRDADDTVQDFWAVMLAAGFRNYDRSQGPLFAYAYKALSRRCAHGTRGPRGKLPLPLTQDQADRSKRLKRLGIKEKWGMRLYTAVQELPFNYRRAVLLKHWFEKKAREAAERCDISVAKYNTWVFQGHEKLRKHFDGQNWSDVA